MATLISPEQARNIGHAVSMFGSSLNTPREQSKVPGLCPSPLSSVRPRNGTKQEPVLLVCRSGKRAAQAADTLERLGFQNVNVLQGGFEAWKAAGLPTHIEEHKPWSLERQVRAIAGSMVLLFTLLGLVVSPWFLGLTLLVGAGLLFAGVTDVCLMATALGKLPWNRRSGATCEI